MFQVSQDKNPMSGLEGRSNLLANLGVALRNKPDFFGSEGRPGDMIGGVTVIFHVRNKY